MASFEWPPTGGSGGSGTVVSVGLADGSSTPIYNISGSPVTDTGTLTFTLATEVKNLVFAGPATGVDAQPTFRALSAADLPVGNLSDVGTDGITIGNGSSAVIGSGTTISQHVADTSHNGYLSSTDWNTFNNKQATITTGNLTSSDITVGNGTGAVIGSGTTLTLPTVNSNVGTFAISTVTVTGKGLVTAASAASTTGSGSVVLATAPTMSNPVVGTQTQGDGSTKAASTSYVDTAVANAVAGVNPAIAVNAATTAAGDTSGFTYNNGVSGIGATFTGTANTAITIDGFTFSALGQRLLVKNDTQSPSGAFNGIYYVTQLQTSILAPILTRALDYNTPTQMNETGAIPVISGTVNTTTTWVQTALIVTVGATALVFTQFSKNPAAYLLVANNLSDVATKATAFNNLSPMSASGDIIYGGASGTGTRLAKGSDGTVLTLASGVPSWAAVTVTGPRSEVWVQTAGGYGATNTCIRYFSTVELNTGSDITYTASSTNGDSFTINTAGIYCIAYSDNLSGNAVFGISKNSNQLTTGFNNITLSAQVGGTESISANDTGNVTICTICAVNDVFRAHTDGTSSGAFTNNQKFRITKVSN